MSFTIYSILERQQDDKADTETAVLGHEVSPIFYCKNTADRTQQSIRQTLKNHIKNITNIEKREKVKL